MNWIWNEVQATTSAMDPVTAATLSLITRLGEQFINAERMNRTLPEESAIKLPAFKPDKLVEKIADFEVWLQRVLQSSGHCNLPETSKCTLILNNVSTQIFSNLYHAGLTSPANYPALVTYLKRHYEITKRVDDYNDEFYAIAQRPHETILDFSARLLHLAVRGEVEGGLNDKNFRRQLLKGMSNVQHAALLREALLLKEDTSYNELVKMAEIKCLAQAANRSASAEEHVVMSVAVDNKGMAKDFAILKDQISKLTVQCSELTQKLNETGRRVSVTEKVRQQIDTKRTFRCYTCGQSDHSSRQCTAWCTICQSKGHSSDFCNPILKERATFSGKCKGTANNLQ